MTKNKKILYSSIIAVVVIVVVILLIILLGGNKLKKYTNKINDNVLTTSTVSTITVVKDSDVVVYQQERLFTIVDKNNATLVITTDALNDEFELKTSKESEIIDDLNSSDLFTLNLSKELFKSYTLKNNNLEATITSENVSKVLNQEVKVNGNATLVITFENNKIKKIECSYQTPSLKNVTISTIYEY